MKTTPSGPQACTQCHTPFTIDAFEKEFYKNVAPTFNGKSYPIPEPEICPQCRQRLRLSFRNLRNLYYRKCDLTGKTILSCYDESTPQPVYNAEDWWSDKWDPLEYGRDFDFSRPFFEQFEELYLQVPVLHHYVINSENCDYMNGAANCKDSYLCFNMDYCESCYYLTDAKHSVSCMDCYNVVDCETCYECVDCERGYNLKYSARCVSCSDSWFLEDCRRCKNCIGCVNLTDKEYHIFNEPVSKEEFEVLKNKLTNPQAIEDFKRKFQEFTLKFPKKYYTGHSNENFSGNHLHHVKNTEHSYHCSNLEDCRYCYYVFDAANCMDYDIFGGNSEWIYNCLATGNQCSNNINCFGVWNGSGNNIYCFLLGGSSNNFGSCGLKKKQYCILNKQYSKKEYEQLVTKIIEHMQSTNEWGKFFPAHLSSFSYQTTMAHEFFPLSEGDAKKRGFNWKEVKKDPVKAEKVIEASQLPKLIADIPDDVLNWAIVCEETGQHFKIIPQELKFYRQHNIPLPRRHPEQRHLDRFTQRTPMHLWERECGKCETRIKTTYAPERPETVYCEECYLKTVY